jgi:hypothetical protein
MTRTLLTLGLGFLLTACAGKGAAERTASPDPSPRIWAEQPGALHARGDRIDVRLRVARAAHFALIHIDPEGRIERLAVMPDRGVEMLEGGRTYQVRVDPGPWSGSGIGYVQLVTSTAPLATAAFDAIWGDPEHTRLLRGDPFQAMDMMRSTLAAGALTSSDFIAYRYGTLRVGIPPFACYGPVPARSPRHWYVDYRSCTTVITLQQRHARYYLGDRERQRSRYAEELRQSRTPIHRYKERPQVPSPRPVPESRTRPGQGAEAPTTPSRPRPRPTDEPERETRTRPAPQAGEEPTGRQRAPEPRSGEREPHARPRPPTR